MGNSAPYVFLWKAQVAAPSSSACFAFIPFVKEFQYHSAYAV